MNCTSNLVISRQLLGHSLCNLSINSKTHNSVDSCLQWNTISMCNVNYIKAGKKHASPTCHSGDRLHTYDYISADFHAVPGQTSTSTLTEEGEFQFPTQNMCEPNLDINND